MKRDLARLRLVAGLVARDLDRTQAPNSAVHIGDGYVLTVRLGANEASALLGAVAEDNWPDEVWWSDPYREGTLDADAAEAVMDEVVDALLSWGISWPTCPEHGVPLGNCSGVWTCDGPPAHHIVVGSLGQ